MASWYGAWYLVNGDSELTKDHRHSGNPNIPRKPWPISQKQLQRLKRSAWININWQAALDEKELQNVNSKIVTFYNQAQSAGTALIASVGAGIMALILGISYGHISSDIGLTFRFLSALILWCLLICCFLMSYKRLTWLCDLITENAYRNYLKGRNASKDEI